MKIEEGIALSIGIVGAGAVGLFFAKLLSQTGPVTLYIKRADQLEALKMNGIHLTEYNQQDPSYYQDERIQFKSVDEEWKEPLIIIAVKQPALISLFENHSHPVRKGQALLFVQNGMGHLNWLDRLDYSTIYAGIIEHGIRKENDTTIHWTGKGRIRCGLVKGEMGPLNPFLTASLLNVEFVNHWRKVMEDKLLVNAVINPLTALYQVPNGEVFDNPHFYKIAFELYLELAAVLGLSKVDQDEKWSYIKQVARQTANNRSSMLQDFDRGKKTENEAILGYVLDLANPKKGSHPLPLTEFIYESIKGMEHHQQTQHLR